MYFCAVITTVHLIGVIATVALLLLVSWLSGRNVKDAKGFMTGGSAGGWAVGGAMLGTLAGGQSTVGTAQLAFCYGLSAWWFTLGAALGALVLGVVYAGPLRRSGCTTLLEVVGREYGRKAETTGSVLSMVGIFISIVAQVLTAAAMIGSLFKLPALLSFILGAALILLFVLFGGIRSAGASGLVKLVLLYTCSLVAGYVVWRLAGGPGGLRSGLEAVFQASPTLASESGITDVESIHRRYGSMVARGPLKDLGGALSLILGVVSTQSYAQCIWSAASTPKARRGALLCTLCMPIIGAACTLAGIYMRGHFVTAAELAAMQEAGETLPAGLGVIASSAQAFPSFILQYLPHWMGGIMLGTLLINIIGCGSGLALGAATILVRDVFSNLQRKGAPGRMSQLTQTRLSIVGLLALAVLFAVSADKQFINDLGFLSLGLRAVAILFPLSFALWLPGRFRPRSVLLSMPLGVAAMLAAHFLSLPGDALYYGLGISLLTLLAGNALLRIFAS